MLELEPRCYRSKSGRRHERALGKIKTMLKADAKVQQESETEGVE